MALKELAVEGMTLAYSNPAVGGVTPSPGPASQKCKVQAKGVYQDGLSITIPAGLTDSSTSCVTGSPYVATISATSLKNNVEGLKALRVGDETSLLSIPGSGPSGACTVSTKVQISNAGQVKVKGE